MKKKYLWGGAIIILGLIGASFIVLTSSKNQSPSLNEIKISDYNSDFFQFERKPIAPPLPSGVNPLDNEKNLTENLAKIYSQELVKRNPNGPANNNNQSQITVPAQNLAQEVFLNQLQTDFKFPQFALKDIKVIDDNSSSSQLQYLQDLQKITEKNFGNSFSNSQVLTAVYNFIEQKNARELQDYIYALAGQTTEVKNLSAPSSWKTFHLQALNLWQKEYTILSSILGMDNDPLKAIVASQELLNANEEEDKLSTTLLKRYQDLTYKP